MRNKHIGTLKAVIIYTFGAFIVQGINYITIPLFANVLSTEDFGLFSSYENWVAIISIIIGLQTAASITNAYTDYGELNIKKYISSVSFIGWISFIIVCIIVFLFRSFFENLFELEFRDLLLGIIQCFFIYFLTMILDQYRVTNKPIAYLFYSLANTLIGLGIGLGLIYTHTVTGYSARVFGVVLAAITVGGIACITIYRQNKMIVKLEYIKYAILLCIPLIFHAFAGIILGKTDQMMLLKITSASEMGIYSYGNKLGHIIYVFYTAVNQVFIPWYYSKKREGKTEEITKLVAIYTTAFGLICIFVLMILPELIQFISPESYRGAINTTPFIVVAFYFNFLYTFPSNHEFYNKKTQYIAIGTMISGLLNVFLNVLFIPKWGGMGAALATCVSMISLFIIHLIVANIIVKNYEEPTMPFIVKGICIIISLVLYFVFIKVTIIRFTIGIVSLVMLIIYTIKKYTHIKSIL